VIPAGVYFIQAGGPKGCIKIGHSRYPASRLRELQTGCPDALTLLGSVRGPVELEKALHLYFSDERVRSDGEWFRSSERLLRTINKMCSLAPQRVEYFVDGYEDVVVAANA